jgi:hypothetical protein
MALMRAARLAGVLACAMQALHCVAPSGPSSGLGAAGEPPPTARDTERAFVPEPSPLAPVDVRRVAAAPKTFIPGDTEPLRVRFVTGATTGARVEIVDEAGALVHVAEVASAGPEGAEVVWDGRDRAGQPAPSGVYLYRIYALDASGRVLGRYGDPAVGGGDEVLAQRFTFDPKSGSMDFVLPEPARVRLRMGVKSLPVLRTYYNWEPLEAGRHTIEWDGLDTTGKIRIVEHPQFRADLRAMSLPENAFYLKRAPRSTRDPCGELCFRLELTDAGTTDDGRPLVGDELRLRVQVDDPAERERLVNVRFEIMIFLDTLYLFEEEDGAIPFNYRIDTRALNPGPHLLTVNVLAYDQRIGIQTLELVKAGP